MPYLKTGSVALWRHSSRPKGPVAILVQTIAAFTCDLDDEATLISPYAPPVNLILSPIHTIQRTLYIICESCVFDVLGLSRKNFIGQRNVDRQVTMHLINHSKSSNSYTYVSCGYSWTIWFHNQKSQKAYRLSRRSNGWQESSIPTIGLWMS